MALHPSVLTVLQTHLKKKNVSVPVDLHNPIKLHKGQILFHLTLFWFQVTWSVLYYTLGFSVVSLSHKSIWQSHYKQFREIKMREHKLL